MSHLHLLGCRRTEYILCLLFQYFMMGELSFDYLPMLMELHHYIL